MPRLSAVLFTALPLLMMMVAQQQQASAGTNHFLGFGNYGIHAIARTEYDVVPTCVVAEHAHEEEMSYTFDPDNWPIFVMDDDEPSGATYEIDDAMEEVMRATAGVCLEEGAWVAGWNVTAVRMRAVGSADAEVDPPADWTRRWSVIHRIEWTARCCRGPILRTPAPVLARHDVTPQRPAELVRNGHRDLHKEGGVRPDHLQ